MSRTVIDQPGIRIVVIGFFLSLIIGFTIRNQISGERVQLYLNTAVDRLKSDFHIDYESAKINLAHWGLPFPALVIEKLRLSPKSLLCQSSQIYIEELEIPISLKMIFGFSKTIPKVRAKTIELRLSNIAKCIGESGYSSTNNNGMLASNDSIIDKNINESNFKSIFERNTKAELREIYVEKFKIISDQRVDQPILLKQLNIELFYSENRLAEARLKSKLNALKDMRSDIYFLNSSLDMLFKSRENGEIESVLSVNGKLLDGDMRFFLHGNLSSEKMVYELSLDHVSARALLPLMSSHKFIENINYERLPISISLKNNGKIFIGKNNYIDSKFYNVQLSILNGVLVLPELELSSINGILQVKPFDVKIEKLPLSILKNSEQFRDKFDSFDNLGILSGKLEYKNENSYKIDGKIENIQTIFSNRGRRDLQKIENVDIKFSRTGDHFRFDANKFKISNEVVAGSSFAIYNINTHEALAQLKLSSVSLNNQVWEQFTFVEQSPKMNLFWNYEKNKIESHDLKIFVDKMALPGVVLSALAIDIKQQLSEIKNLNSLNVRIKPSTMLLESDFLKNKYVNQVFGPINSLNSKSLTSSKSNLVLTGHDWKDIAFDLNSHLTFERNLRSDTVFNLKGSIGSKNGLSAQINIAKKNNQLKFEVKKLPDSDLLIKALQ